MGGVKISLRIINLLFYNLMPLPSGRGFLCFRGVMWRKQLYSKFTIKLFTYEILHYILNILDFN